MQIVYKISKFEVPRYIVIFNMFINILGFSFNVSSVTVSVSVLKAFIYLKTFTDELKITYFILYKT